jgi:hypothetical protein
MAGVDTITPSVRAAATNRASKIDWTSRDACIWMTVSLEGPGPNACSKMTVFAL